MKSLDKLIEKYATWELGESNELQAELKNDLLDWVEELIGEDEPPFKLNGSTTSIHSYARNQLRSELRDKVKRERKK